MPIVERPGMRPVRMGDLEAQIVRRDDGSWLVQPRRPLDAYPRSIIERLDHWAEAVPGRSFLVDRGGGEGWRHLSYAQAAERSRAIASFLLAQGLSADAPVMILSGNSIEHGLLALGALRAGIPYAPVSPAYSLVSQDHARLRYLVDLITPGMIFVADPAPFERALRAILRPGITLVTSGEPIPGVPSIDFERLVAWPAGPEVDAAHAGISGDTIAKFLFTSGSTGMPKAVVNTHRMLACNQVMIRDALAFLGDEPPVLVDWLPWNHTAGGNHNFGIALHNGGTLYIDDGSPTPAGIGKTVRNLQDIAPTLYFNVPKGYEMLVERLEADRALAETFFSRVRLLQYAGAGLAQHVWDGLTSLARRTVGEEIMIVTGYGSTETAPFASTTTWPVGRPGEVGLPAPGVTMKLVPSEGKLELRLKGPSVTPGYWRQPDKTAESFDEEGFYRIGDALRFVDPDDVNRGLLFDGRVAEDFKLATGTWVNMAAVRSGIVRHFAPYVREAVLTGLDRNHIGALLFLDPDAAGRFAPELHNADERALAAHPGLRALLQERLDALAAKSTGSATLVARAIILDAPPAIDRSEITDKGSINQRAVMAARPQLVDDLYAEPAPPHVLVAKMRS